MFLWLAKRRLRKYGYTYMPKYRIWVQPEYRMFFTDKWVREFTILVKDYARPFWQPMNYYVWRSSLHDTEFSPELITKIMRELNSIPNSDTVVPLRRIK